MKKIFVYIFVLFGITINFYSLSQKNQDSNSLELPTLFSQAYADGETTIEDCMKSNCLPLGIFCFAVCDGYVVSFPDRLHIPTWP